IPGQGKSGSSSSRLRCLQPLLPADVPMDIKVGFAIARRTGSPLDIRLQGVRAPAAVCAEAPLRLRRASEFSLDGYNLTVTVQCEARAGLFKKPCSGF